MNKFWLLGTALAGSLVLTAPAHAFLFDGFGDDQGPVADETADATGESTGSMPITDTDLTNAQRTITAFLDSTDGTGSRNQVTAGTGGGVYDHSQTDGETGHSEILWSFDSQSLDDPITLVVDVRSIDLTASLEFTLEDGSGNTSTDTVAVTGTGSQLFSFSSFDGIDMTDVTGASLLVDGSGTPSLDMSLNFIEVPAPGVLGLLGIGLAALGFSVRRRRQEDIA